MTKATKGDGTAVNFTYDTFGRRILKNVNNGARTRYFFNGLTEEIKKESGAGAWASGAAGTTVHKSLGLTTAN